MSRESVKNRTARRRGAYWLGCLMIAAGLAFAGCGSGDGDGGSETPELTGKQFVLRVKTICAKAKQNTAEFNEDLPDRNATPGEAQQFFEKIAPFSEQAAEEIAALPAPSDQQLQTLQDAYARGAREIAAAAESPAKAKAALKSQAGGLGSCAFALPGS